MTTAQEFLTELSRLAPEGSRVLGAQFLHDPNQKVAGMWYVRPVFNIENMNERANCYLTVSSFYPDPPDEFGKVKYHRRKNNFAAGLCLMIDDIGGGIGSKFGMKLLEKLPPTALIETSPDNHQAVYIFSEAITNEDKFNSLIDAFIRTEFIGKDTGMGSVTRVFRPPYGMNSKAKYIKDGKKHVVTAKIWRPDLRYSYEQICEAFKLKPAPPKKRLQAPREIISDYELNHRVNTFYDILGEIERMGLITGDGFVDKSDGSAWLHITCPWVNEHSGGIDDGAAIARPDAENGYFGAFVCHHNHFELKTGKSSKKHFIDLARHFEWVTRDKENEIEQILEQANLEELQNV